MSKVRTNAADTPLSRIRKLKKELKAKDLQVLIKSGEAAYWKEKAADIAAKMAVNEDRLLPQKQALLKELSFLVNATSKAVRTTMWSLAPEKRRGW